MVVVEGASSVAVSSPAIVPNPIAEVESVRHFELQ